MGAKPVQAQSQAPFSLPGACFVKRDYALVNLLCQDLMKYVPHWCNESGPMGFAESADGESGNMFLEAMRTLAGSHGSGSTEKSDKMSLLQWVVAFQRYALAAACSPIDGAQGNCIWNYESAMAHMNVVLQVRLSPFCS